tara:strand:+ start:2236 stop:2502 length:267 start_codon:yes stop_codon:yes gene_type:complete
VLGHPPVDRASATGGIRIITSQHVDVAAKCGWNAMRSSKRISLGCGSGGDRRHNCTSTFSGRANKLARNFVCVENASAQWEGHIFRLS